MDVEKAREPWRSRARSNQSASACRPSYDCAYLLRTVSLRLYSHRLVKLRLLAASCAQGGSNICSIPIPSTAGLGKVPIACDMAVASMSRKMAASGKSWIPAMASVVLKSTQEASFLKECLQGPRRPTNLPKPSALQRETQRTTLGAIVMVVAVMMAVDTLGVLGCGWLVTEFWANTTLNPRLKISLSNNIKKPSNPKSQNERCTKKCDNQVLHLARAATSWKLPHNGNKWAVVLS